MQACIAILLRSLTLYFRISMPHTDEQGIEISLRTPSLFIQNTALKNPTQVVQKFENLILIIKVLQLKAKLI